MSTPAQANYDIAVTNFVGALSQCEAALEIFRRQGRGHLVLISSIAALRGMRKTMTTYAATKPGWPHWAKAYAAKTSLGSRSRSFTPATSAAT